MAKRLRVDGETRAGGDETDEDNEFCICEVNKHNLDVVSKLVLSAAASCDFVAFDTEFSGLDHGEAFRSPTLEVRYGAFRAMIDKFALIQFGLCFVRRKPDGSGWRSLSFTFQVVRMTPYTVAPVSMIFLAENGVSLTDVYKRGIPFTPPAEGVMPEKLQLLLHAVAAYRKPLVVHNGLADLLFLWRSFFAQLPETSVEWIASMTEVFPIVYDTKHLSSTVAQEEASYLQYLFRSFRLRKRAAMECVAVPMQYQILEDQSMAAAPTEVCRQFARHGNCRRGPACSFSHDVDFIVHEEYAKETGQAAMVKSKPNNSSQRNQQRPQLSHSAGFDAFATAFVFASYWDRFGEEKMRANANHVYLMYAQRPMLFIKSQY